MKNVKIVIGANFGDEGKGLATDYFADKAMKESGNCIVVCSNGGAQKGHTITTPEGLRHVTNHFGSGILVGADTYLSEDYIVNPILFRKEREALISKGVTPPNVFVNAKCIVTTPYDMLINQIIEEHRSGDKHGSCGVGIFETIKRNQLGFCLAFSVFDLEFKEIIELSLDFAKNDYIYLRLKELGVDKIPDKYVDIINSNILVENYMNDIKYFLNHTTVTNSDNIIMDWNNIIFECSQGLLLDKNNTNYFPHLTPSNTGVINPMKIINRLSCKDINIEVCYIARTYMTRHGAGKFVTECDKSEIADNIVDLTNVPNPYQDTIRYGKLDTILLYETIKNDLKDIPDGVQYIPSLMITHINETGGYIKDIYGDIKIDKFANIEGFKRYLSDGLTRESVVN